MVVRIDRTRMAMGRDSRCYAYEGLVLASDVPHIQPHQTTTICPDGCGFRSGYYAFHAATLPAAHYQMAPGWDRYDQFRAHERAAKVELLALAKTVYPELANVTEWPSLWVELPAIDETHATRYAERQPS